MQNCDNKIIEIAENIKRKQNEMGNKTPSLSNIYDTLLEEFPKIKDKSEKVREIIIQHLKTAETN